MEERVCVQQLAVENRIQAKLDVHSAAFAWLVETAVDSWNKQHVAADGKTAYERLKSKKYRGDFLPFASPVMLRVAGKVRGGEMTERWLPGLWVGKRFHTNEDVVIRESDGAAVRTKAVKVMPEPLTAEMLSRIRGIPSAPKGAVQDDVPDVEVPRVSDGPEGEPEGPEGEPEMPVPRSMRITQDVVERLGYSDKCLKCRCWARGDYSRPGLGHSVECRRRIERLLGRDELLKKRHDEAEERKNR